MMNTDLTKLVYPYGTALCSGQIKHQPEDFKVVEKLGYDFTSAGEHLFLFIQKTGLTTHQLIDKIAEDTGVAARQIGYSGLKDKQAVTQQWISVQLPGCKQIPTINQTDQLMVLQSHWHDKKLRVGTHKSNQFEIIIRNIKGLMDNLTPVIQKIESSGFANYFGQQRFGVQQDNVGQALKVLNNRHKCKRLTRTKKSLYLSALRSELFNQILSSRIQQDIWSQPVDGDAYMLAGSQSVFTEALADEIIQRYKEFDIHSGVSLLGAGDSRLDKQALAIENEVIASNSDIYETLVNNKIKRSFRANRALAKNLQVKFLPEQQEIHIKVELDKGVYLTTLLNHLVEI